MQVVAFRLGIMYGDFGGSRLRLELHERSLLPQQQLTQSIYELQRCRLEQCKLELGVKEAERDQLIEVCPARVSTLWSLSVRVLLLSLLLAYCTGWLNHYCWCGGLYEDHVK